MTRGLILTSDWHVARGAWRHKGVTGDAWFALEWLVDRAIASGFGILAAGDLYDAGDPDPDSVAVVHRQCDRLEAAGLPLYYTVGQHERRRADATWIGTHRWPTHVGDGRTVEIPLEGGGLWVQGFDWTPASRIPELLERVDRTADLLMLHQVAREVMEGRPGGCEIVLADVPGDAAILIGDYHETKRVWAGEHLVLSPGSLAMQSIDEPERKGHWLMRRDERGTLLISREDVPSRPVARFHLDSADELDRFLASRPWLALEVDDRLPAALRRPLVRVTFDDALPAAAARLTEAIDPDAHLFLNPVRRDGAVSVPAAATAAGSLEAALLAATEPGDPARELLAALLREDRRGVPAAIDDARERFLEAGPAEAAPRDDAGDSREADDGASDGGSLAAGDHGSAGRRAGVSGVV